MTLKLEIDKIYFRKDGGKVKIIYKVDDNLFVGQRVEWPNTISGYSLAGVKQGWSDTASPTLVKEYKEPVVHNRILLWYKDLYGNVLCTLFLNKEYADNFSGIIGHKELKREEVTYTEE